jgi:hypothetical protein
MTASNPTDTLLPCPFCGGDATVGVHGKIPEYATDKVGCSKCNVWITGSCGWAELQAERWNTRADLVPQVATTDDRCEWCKRTNTAICYGHHKRVTKVEVSDKADFGDSVLARIVTAESRKKLALEWFNFTVDAMKLGGMNEVFLGNIEIIRTALAPSVEVADTREALDDYEKHLSEMLCGRHHIMKPSTALKIRAALQRPQDGWKLVPEEATEEMMEKAFPVPPMAHTKEGAVQFHKSVWPYYAVTYKALVAAAPTKHNGKAE